ncbi:MAG: hypothetical protein JWM80_1018 [Cyanobacteria bacterium RYN_339]|nr:hypothetical protein [Cyanobacteria bacterium RYN_339]
MDSYKSNAPDKDKDKDKQPGPPPQKKGTGSLNLDSFQSHGTASLNRNLNATGTRRLGTSGLDVDKTIGAMTTEVENGKIIVSKLEGRIAVLQRAMRIMQKPAEVAQICAGISPGEANFTKQVAKVLGVDPAITQRVQVALYQFEQARKGLEQADEALGKAPQYEGPAKAQFVESQLHVEKLRGQLYPLINLHVVFKDNPLLSQLIPTPKITAQEDVPPPLPPEPLVEEKPVTGALAASSLANDPAVREVVDTFNRVTGSLKNRLGGLFKAPAKPEEKK